MSHLKKPAQDNKSGDSFITVNINIHDNNEFSKEITRDEVDKCILKLKNNKVAAIDNIINEYIKNTKHILGNLYEILLNKTLETAYILED